MKGVISKQMTDFSKSYALSRGRFETEVKALTQAGISYRLFPGALTIAEMAVHVAGVELWFFSQITGEQFPDHERVMKCATAGVVNEDPFPFSEEELTVEFVQQTLDFARSKVQRLIEEPSAEELKVELKSALGPIITGEGALARMAFHPAYHHGQVYQIITSPGYPG